MATQITLPKDANGRKIPLDTDALYDKNGEEHIFNKHPFEMVSKNGNLYTFEAKIEANTAGSFKTGIRMYPKNKELPHRQDFCYIKWLD